MGRWRRYTLGCALVFGATVGCGPSSGEETLADGDGGGGGGEFDTWEPPDDAQTEPGPRVVAMATRGAAQQLVAIGDRGEVTPYGPELPPSVDGAALRQLVYDAEVGRGAVLRKSEDGSDVFAFWDETFHEVGVDLPPVQWIELSREGWLIVLHHQDNSTTVVSHDDEVVLELDPPADENRNNWLGFGDGDTWVLWSRELEPDDIFTGKTYWVRELATGQTRELATVPFGTDYWYTFGTSTLLQQVSGETDTMWMDLDGDEIDVPGMPTTRIGPGRHFFADGKAYALSDRSVDEVGPQAMVPGYVHSYVPGRYAVVETDEGGVVVLPPDGAGNIALNPGYDSIYDTHGVSRDPDNLQIVVSRHFDGDTVDQNAYSLWRPWTNEMVFLGYDYAEATTRFTEDGTLIRMQKNGIATAVMPDADELAELDTSPWQLEGFRWAHEVEREPPQRGED